MNTRVGLDVGGAHLKVALTENGRPASDSVGVERTVQHVGIATYALGSGHYRFVFTPSN
jgi:hypothetical protein